MEYKAHRREADLSVPYGYKNGYNFQPRFICLQSLSRNIFDSWGSLVTPEIMSTLIKTIQPTDEHKSMFAKQLAQQRAQRLDRLEGSLGAHRDG